VEEEEEEVAVAVGVEVGLGSEKLKPFHLFRGPSNFISRAHSFMLFENIILYNPLYPLES